MIVGRSRAQGRPKGARAAADAQLSEKARQLLVWLIRERDQLQRGSPEQQLTVRNKGIPWSASNAATALGVLPASITRTLTSLEDREIICCWATGEGRGRRISHVKLSAQAVRVTWFQQDFGMSEAQRKRHISRARTAFNEQMQMEIEMGERWERENVSIEDRQRELNEVYGHIT